MQRVVDLPWLSNAVFWMQKMKTINLSVEHPALKDFVTLASMDCQSESTNTLSEFWSQVNSVIV